MLSNLFKLFLSTALIAQPAFAQNAINTSEQFPGINYQRNFVKNPGAEKNKSNVTDASTIVTRSTSTPLEGAASFSIDATASAQLVKFDTNTLDNSLKGQNCEAKFVGSGDATLYKAYVEQGSTKVTADLTLTFPTYSQPYSINFPCGDLSSNSHLVIESTGNGAAIKVDSVYTGLATNLGSAPVVASALYTGNPPTGTLAGSYNTVIFGTQVIDTANAYSGGTYTVPMTSSCSISAEIRVGAVSASVGNSLSLAIHKNGSELYSKPSVIDVSSNSTLWADINVQGTPLVAGDLITIKAQTNVTTPTYTSGAAVQQFFSIVCYGTNQQSINSNNTPGSWSGYHANDCQWTTTSTSFVTPSADATCTFTESTNVNFGTVASSGAKTPGVVFTPQSVGKYYICATVDGGANSTASAFTSYSLNDGSTTIAESTIRDPVGGTTVSVPLCGIYDVASISAKTMSVQMKVGSGTGYIDYATALGRAINWSIVQITSAFPAPLLVGSVTSNTSGQERIERVSFGGASAHTNCTSTPCTVSSQSGSWVSSVTRSGTGVYSISIAAGMFSSAPICTCIGKGVGSTNGWCQMTDTPNSTSAVPLQTLNSAGAFVDNAVEVICMGPR